MRPTARWAAPLLLCTVAACCDTDVKDVDLAGLPSPEATAELAAAPAGTHVRLVLGYESSACLDVPGAAADVGGAGLERQDVYVTKGCGCGRNPTFEGTVPAEPSGAVTVRAVEGAATVGMTIAALHEPRTVALRAPATALTPGERVYLDLAPATDTVTELAVSFHPAGGASASFTLGPGDARLTRDATGWSFVVPDAAAGEGRLDVWTRVNAGVSGCTGATACAATGTYTRSLQTAVVR